MGSQCPQIKTKSKSGSALPVPLVTQLPLPLSCCHSSCPDPSEPGTQWDPFWRRVLLSSLTPITLQSREPASGRFLRAALPDNPSLPQPRVSSLYPLVSQGNRFPPPPPHLGCELREGRYHCVSSAQGWVGLTGGRAASSVYLQSGNTAPWLVQGP